MTAPVPPAPEEGVRPVAWLCRSAYDPFGLACQSEAEAWRECRDRGLDYVAVPLYDADVPAILARANTAKVAADLMRARAERAEAALEFYATSDAGILVDDDGGVARRALAIAAKSGGV